MDGWMDGWKVLLLFILTITFYQKQYKCGHRFFHYAETKGIRKDFQYFRSTWRPCFSLIPYSEKIKRASTLWKKKLSEKRCSAQASVNTFGTPPVNNVVCAIMHRSLPLKLSLKVKINALKCLVWISSFATNRGLWNVFTAATNLFFGATLQGEFFTVSMYDLCLLFILPKLHRSNTDRGTALFLYQTAEEYTKVSSLLSTCRLRSRLARLCDLWEVEHLHLGFPLLSDQVIHQTLYNEWTCSLCWS